MSGGWVDAERLTERGAHRGGPQILVGPKRTTLIVGVVADAIGDAVAVADNSRTIGAAGHLRGSSARGRVSRRRGNSDERV